MAKVTPWVLCCFLAAVAGSVAGAAAPAPSPGLGCSDVIFDMMSCLDYVSAGSNVTEPPESCCKGVAAVVAVSASCLCDALAMAPTVGVPLNMSRAAGIPDSCSVEIPPGQHCDAASMSPLSSAPMAASPTMSPAPASPSTVPAQPPTSGASAVFSSSSVLLLVGLLAVGC